MNRKTMKNIQTTGLSEDFLKLSEETKQDIKKSEDDFRKGRVNTLEQIKIELGLN